MDPNSPSDDVDLFAPWQLDAAPTLIREAANAVFVGTRAGETVYVRLTTLDHRDEREVQAEATWMRELADAGLRVVRPLGSRGGRLVEPARWRGSPALTIALTAAPGRHARKPDDFTPPVLASWAELLVGLHAHARAVRPHERGGRREWHADRVFVTAMDATAPETRDAQRVLRDLVLWLRALPRDDRSYGLTHADLHLGNLSVTNGDDAHVTAFDFDDACVHWFAHDVAVAVTSIRKAGWEHPGRVDAEDAEARFLTAYARAAAAAGIDDRVLDRSRRSSPTGSRCRRVGRAARSSWVCSTTS